MAPPRKGQLIWRKTKGWCARVRMVAEGEKVRPIVELGTRDKLVATRRLKRLLDESDDGIVTQASLDKATSDESFEDAIGRIHAQRKNEDGVKSADDELGRLRHYAEPLLGQLPVTEIETTHINSALRFCKSQGKSKQTVIHLKQALRAVFGELKREGAIASNPVGDAELPRFKQEAKRERVILTDEEFAEYLAYAPADDRSRRGVLERQTLACVSRMFGGLRTGDLHALTWGQHIDVEAFEYGIAPRQKTATPQLLEIPEMLRPTLRNWWDLHGQPEDGPVFPIRRGKDAGQPRRKQSHAKALRRDLKRMLGVEQQVLRQTRTGERLVWETRPQEEWTRRQRELFTDTTYSLRVDFHSFRRAFNTALADAGVNIQVAMRLAGHTSTAAHMRYVMSRVRTMPEAALPRLGDGSIGQASCPIDEGESANSWRSLRDLNPRYRRERPAS